MRCDNNMKNDKKVQTILFAGIITAMILPFSMIDFADAQNGPGEDSTDEVGPVGVVDELTKQEFKDDIRELIDDADTKDFQAKSNEIKAEYDEFFSTVIEQSRVDSETRNLTDVEIAAVKNYIFDETIKDEKLKALQESNYADRIDVSFLDWFGIQTASAACSSTTNPTYKQLRLDIDGGSIGWLYHFNGDNDLYLVSYNDNSVDCERTYSLYFYDEDHPTLDAAYDRVRIIMYDRIHDIEIFTIKNNNQIEFDNTWSNSWDYLCTTIYCHATTTKPYTPGQIIYVSNTWNHMMDISDTNRSLSKVSVP